MKTIANPENARNKYPKFTPKLTSYNHGEVQPFTPRLLPRAAEGAAAATTTATEFIVIFVIVADIVGAAVEMDFSAAGSILSPSTVDVLFDLFIVIVFGGG